MNHLIAIAIVDQHHSLQFKCQGLNPCIHIHTQVKVLTVQQSRNQGRDIYEQVAHTVGIHITNGCNDCTFS